MTKWAEFTEKTFEKYFSHQLARMTKITFSPDSVDEFYLGFDEAFRLPQSINYILRMKLLLSPSLWRCGMHLSEVDDFMKHVGYRLPPFRFNLFIQYKRPEYVFGHRGAEWSSWEQPYYRYKITKHQQDALARLQQAAHQRAAVVYASAAFLKNEHLFKFVRSERVIQESNIASVEKIANHACYTYISCDGNGVAHSEPEKIDSPTFDEIMQNAEEQEEMNLYDHVINISNIVTKCTEVDEEIDSEIQAARDAILISSGIEMEDHEVSKFVHAMSTVAAFSDIINVRLYAVG